MQPRDYLSRFVGGRCLAGGRFALYRFASEAAGEQFTALSRQ